MLPLACTVRACARPLARGARAWTCTAGHAFDIARSGYVNLLQPHDRRSRSPGDSRDVVRARAQLLASGVGGTLRDAVLALVAMLPLDEGAVVAELGSGTGDTLGAVARARGAAAIGIDLSAAAAEHAARLFPQVTWIVANADRRLPLLDASVDLVLSLHARRNPEECARVLRPGGHLLVAVPGADDLTELRTATLGYAVALPPLDALLADHDPRFTVVRRSAVRERRTLEAQALRALLATTYRGGRRRATDRVETLTSLDVTLASELALLAPRGLRTSA